MFEHSASACISLHQPKKLTSMMHWGPATLAHQRDLPHGGFFPASVVTALLLIQCTSFGFPFTLAPSHTLLHATLTCC